MSEENYSFAFDDDFEQALEDLPEATNERDQAEKHYKEHLWDLVLIAEHRLIKQGIEPAQAYTLSCAIIAEWANYEGGKCRYLPRGDKLKQELRNIRMFRLWHEQSWSIERIHNEFCPELNQMQVYKVLSDKRKAHLKKIQPLMKGLENE